MCRIPDVHQPDGLLRKTEPHRGRSPAHHFLSSGNPAQNLLERSILPSGLAALVRYRSEYRSTGQNHLRTGCPADGKNESIQPVDPAVQRNGVVDMGANAWPYVSRFFSEG